MVVSETAISIYKYILKTLFFQHNSVNHQFLQVENRVSHYFNDLDIKLVFALEAERHLTMYTS